MKLNSNELNNVEKLTSFLLANGIKDTKLTKAITAANMPSSGIFKDFDLKGFATFKDGQTSEQMTVEQINEQIDAGNTIDTDFRHLVMICTDGSEISVSRLQESGFLGAINEVDGIKTMDLPQVENFVQSKKDDSFYLKPNFTPNPNFLGSQAVLALRLKGAKFTSENISYYRQNYVKGGIKNIDEAMSTDNLSVRKNFVVSLVTNEAPKVTPKAMTV